MTQQIDIKEIPFLGGFYCDNNGNIYKGNDKLNLIAGGYKGRYLKVSIKGGKHYVHRLVLQTFIGDAPEGMQACHNDGNPRNNNLNNLRWDTPKNNSRDKIEHGTSGAGQQNSMAKLTDAQANNIIYVYQLVQSKELSKAFNVSQSYISAIATGRVRLKKEFKLLYSINRSVARKRVLEASLETNKKRAILAKKKNINKEFNRV